MSAYLAQDRADTQPPTSKGLVVDSGDRRLPARPKLSRENRRRCADEHAQPETQTPRSGARHEGPRTDQARSAGDWRRAGISARIVPRAVLDRLARARSIRANPRASSYFTLYSPLVNSSTVSKVISSVAGSKLICPWI